MTILTRRIHLDDALGHVESALLEMALKRDAPAVRLPTCSPTLPCCEHAGTGDHNGQGLDWDPYPGVALGFPLHVKRGIGAVLLSSVLTCAHERVACRLPAWQSALLATVRIPRRRDVRCH